MESDADKMSNPFVPQGAGTGKSGRAAGIDLGGTKIEAQIFGPDWGKLAQRRIETPKDYNGLVTALANLIAWVTAEAGQRLPVGIAAAGLINPATGLAFTANLPAMGRPLPADIARAAGQPVAYLNDCRALTLSEAVFGAARGKSVVAGVILGTGIGGGVAVQGQVLAGHAGMGGEFGHFPLAAPAMIRHGLPVLRCGCGHSGCTETLLSGPGLARLAQHLTGREMTPPQIVAARASDPAMARVWAIWCELLAEMLKTLCFVLDPACIVLGGGLSQAEGLIDDLQMHLARLQLEGFASPEVRLAEGGDASGARGAAYAAWLEAGHVA